MAQTTYPGQIQTFPQMQDITVADAPLVQQYQEAIQAGNLDLAQQILASIPNGEGKVITADYLDTINNTLVALQEFFNLRYSPAYIVSPTQPAQQEVGDYWFHVTNTIA